MIAFKFLARDAVSPFTRFEWPPAGEWVHAPEHRADSWVFACRATDLAHWVDQELWRVELDAPIRESRYQIASARARLVARVAGWDERTAWDYARACAFRARDLALPHLAPALRGMLAGESDLGAIEAASRGAAEASRAAGFLADAAGNAARVGPATASYIDAVLAASLGGGLAAFEAERAWQARWLVERLGLLTP